METFTLNPCSWQIFRIIGRNPLLRRCDRIEALVTLVGVVAMLIALPVAGLAGSVVYSARDHHYAHERLTRQAVVATVITVGMAAQPDGGTNADRPNSPFDLGGVVVTARWNSPAGERTGTIRRSSPAEPGQHLRIWVDPGGNRVDPPTPAYCAVVDAAIAAGAVLLGIFIAVSCLLGMTHWRADRVRDAQWEREIGCLQRDTGRSNQQ